MELGGRGEDDTVRCALVSWPGMPGLAHWDCLLKPLGRSRCTRSTGGGTISGSAFMHIIYYYSHQAQLRPL